MRKLRLYIETSVWNLNIKGEDSIRTDATKRFFGKAQEEGHKLYISPTVIIEIDRTKNNILKNELKTVLEIYQPSVLEETLEILALSEDYLKEGIIPERYVNDAIHIAYTAFYELDAIVSWNMKHIVKMKTRKLVNYINMIQGYRNIDFATPEEVFDYE
jgi:predicted nucleic acid-binding protein